MSWQDDALCRQIGPDDLTWFPPKGGSTRAAKRLCMQCDVRPECLEDALKAGYRYGIFGGLSERERRPLRARMERERGVA